jgi:protein SCO1/2
MQENIWTRFILILFVLSCALVILPGSPVSADSRWGANYFPNIELTTQDGKTVHFYDDLIKGKIVAIDLIYTTCQYSCPLETARLAQVQKMLGDRVGKDIFFYSITIDPKNDTPQVLKGYAEKFHAGPGWTFLTGKKEDIDFLSKKLGLYSDPAATLDGHTPHLLLGNEPMGQWMRNSALDNPRFLSQIIGDFLDSFRNMKPAQGKETTESAAIHLDPGQYLFTKKCGACHTVGQGDKIGPDLAGVTDSRNRDWLMRKIQHPEQLLAEKDAITMALAEKYGNVNMPNLRVSDDDANYMIGYLVSRTSELQRQARAARNAATKPADSVNGTARPN